MGKGLIRSVVAEFTARFFGLHRSVVRLCAAGNQAEGK
jgi:hypothetical protein